VSMSKYLQAAYAGDVYTIHNPAVTLVTTTTAVGATRRIRLATRAAATSSPIAIS